MKKIFDRCWEHMRCGEERTCSSYPDKGEVCWEIVGTMRDNASEKRLEKQATMARQDGRDMTEQELLMQNPVRMVKLCKFIERFGSCKCCPYYHYVEQEKKSRTIRKNFDAF